MGKEQVSDSTASEDGFMQAVHEEGPDDNMVSVFFPTSGLRVLFPRQTGFPSIDNNRAIVESSKGVRHRVAIEPYFEDIDAPRQSEVTPDE
jgi:hypothetical protein